MDGNRFAPSKPLPLPCGDTDRSHFLEAGTRAFRLRIKERSASQNRVRPSRRNTLSEKRCDGEIYAAGSRTHEEREERVQFKGNRGTSRLEPHALSPALRTCASPPITLYTPPRDLTHYRPSQPSRAGVTPPQCQERDIRVRSQRSPPERALVVGERGQEAGPGTSDSRRSSSLRYTPQESSVAVLRAKPKTLRARCCPTFPTHSAAGSRDGAVVSGPTAGMRNLRSERQEEPK
ncbi:hypothetical protein AAFF_G00260280 [Aldrovandia affinis]|uniref:Uncharacterized protein n=1 Tax=Aldrovandia affinis TaxID=143900 RepID=A0AAD7W2X7_9TELE|nr:hypothetical protein AAFF_G00260280 [Aldrovandia affinis]